MDERRQLPRWEIKQEAKVWLPQTQGYNHCTIEDMHLKGMCVSLKRSFPEQNYVKMAISLGDNFNLINVEAQIPWCKQEGDRYVYGLCFRQIADQDKERMYQYINANCYDQFKSKWWA